MASAVLAKFWPTKPAGKGGTRISGQKDVWGAWGGGQMD